MTTYQITVKGRIDPDWLSRPGNITVYRTNGDSSGYAVVLLQVCDDGELMGQLREIHERDVQLLSLYRVGPDASPMAELGPNAREIHR